MAQKKITQRVLLIPLDKLAELEIEIKTLKEVPLEQKKEIAVADLSFFEFMDYVNTAEEFRNISLEEVHCEWYDENTDYFFVELAEYDDDINIALNKELELHIKHEDGGYSVDSYRFFEGEEDHDYDEDFISSFWVAQDDLMEDEDEE